MTAGQSARLTFSFDLPEGMEQPPLIGALTVRNQRVPMQADGDSALIIPPQPPGVHLAEVRAGGTCILYGHIEVLPSPLGDESGTQDYSISVDMTADVLSVNVTLAEGPQGPPGPQGEPGASAYDLAVAAGYTGTQDEWATAQMECAQQAASAAASASAAQDAAAEAASSAEAAALSATSAQSASDAASASASAAAGSQSSAAASSDAAGQAASAATAAADSAAASAEAAAASAAAVTIPRTLITRSVIGIGAIYNGDHIIIVPDDDDVDVDPLMSSVSASTAVTITVTASAGSVVIYNGDAVVDLVPAGRQISGSIVRLDGDAVMTLDGAPAAPDGTADDVIIMSNNNTVATFRWPNRMICNTNSELGIPSTVQTITGEAPQLINADNMFQSQAGSFEFSVSMPELRYAYGMFQKSGITKFESDVPHLKDGSYMFAGASLTEFTASLDRLE